MRNLSDKEKEIIKNILFRSEECGSDWVDLSMVYNHIFGGNRASYDSGTLYLPYDNCYDEASINFYREVLETTILLKQLEENRYIHIMDKSMDSNKIKGHYYCSDKLSPKGYSLKLSPEISQIFDDANNKQLFVSQRLRILVENDFKTYEDIQLDEAQKQTQKAQDSFKEAQKQTKLSFGAVMLSILAIIASIFVPRCTPSTIEQKQYDSIQIMQDELIKTLKEIKISQIDNDSLIKQLNLVNQSIDDISNSLNKMKKSKSTRK